MSEPTTASDEPSPSVEALRRLLESAGPANPERPEFLTDSLVGPADGDLLRRCAVPHEFDAALLAWIGDRSADDATRCFEKFDALSIMQVAGDDALSIHERWRAPLWRWWLMAPQRERFVALSEKLVDWFTQPPSPSGEDPAARRRMFHLLGCRRDAGMADFDRLFRAARHHRRFSECTLLIGLVREYDPVLTPHDRLLLRYHEGKILNDLRQWERAVPVLRAVADDVDGEARLRVNAAARAANALRQLQRAGEAATLLEDALQRTAPGSGAEASRWRVLYELGELERDRGRVDAAAEILQRALALVQAGTDPDADVAGLLNSLGTVQLKQRERDAAVASFDASLERLQRDGDALRTGTVLNNLGLAQLERCDWPAAEAALHGSLAVKRSAADVRGQATTLLNLARAQAAQGRHVDAVKSADEARALFEQAADQGGIALAEQTRARVRHGGGSPSTDDTPDPGLPWWAWTLAGLGGVSVVAVTVWMVMS